MLTAKEGAVNNFTNSKLVQYTQLSPHRNSPRNQPIRKVTIHHFAGRLSVETVGAMQSKPETRSSYNYTIGFDGRIGMSVEEKDRCWGTSSPANDNQAVVIGVSNSAIGGDWPVSDASYIALVNLVADICRRNNIRLEWTGDSSGTLTVHRWFSATACPGEYLFRRMASLASDVNSRLECGGK